MNILEKENAFKDISSLLRVLGHPVRLRILQEISSGEACVCHLEALLDIRQAYLSQHLMALRKAGALITRREGRFIYYRIVDKKIMDIVDSAAKIVGVDLIQNNHSQRKCDCPKCCEG